MGIYYPSALPAFAGRLYGTKREMEDLYNLLYVAGGLAGTMVQEADYLNPETRPYLDKYYQGAEGTTAEERIRAFNLVRDLTTSEYAGWHHTSVVCGMGMPRTYMDFTRKFFDLERVKQNARSSSGITTRTVSLESIARTT